MYVTQENTPESPCHHAPVDPSLGEGVIIGSCSACGQPVARVNPRTGNAEWLDGQDPCTPRDDLRPMMD